MKKYGKFIKRAFRSNKGTLSVTSKARRISEYNRFKRRINNIGEKKIKITNISGAGTYISSQGVTTVQGVKLLNSTRPTFGSLDNQMIGTKIFARYFHVEITYYNTNDNSYNGPVFTTLLKEKHRFSHDVTNSDLFTPGYGNGVNKSFLKTNYSLMKDLEPIKLRNYNSQLYGDTYLHKRKFRFKIMKEIHIQTDTYWNIPDWIIINTYTNSLPGSSVGNGCVINYKLTLTYSDI